MTTIINRYNSHLSAVLSRNELDITRERDKNLFQNQRIIEEEEISNKLTNTDVCMVGSIVGKAVLIEDEHTSNPSPVVPQLDRLITDGYGDELEVVDQINNDLTDVKDLHLNSIASRQVTPRSERKTERKLDFQISPPLSSNSSYATCPQVRQHISATGLAMAAVDLDEFGLRQEYDYDSEPTQAEALLFSNRHRDPNYSSQSS